jgi:hypothetical protein
MIEPRVIVLQVIIDNPDDRWPIPDDVVANCVRNEIDGLSIDVDETYKGVIIIQRISVT